MFRSGDKIGPYTLQGDKCLGRGGFGEVWQAVNENDVLHRIFAVKLPRDQDINFDNIRGEARLWLSLSGHPNIVPFIAAEKHREQVIIVSEFADGGDLLGWLKNNGGKAPTMEVAVKMLHGILDGLEHLHSKNIVHRDLKPANILLQNNVPRLADFGISKILQNTHESSSASIGTPHYMPPEAFDGKRSFQTDIWAIGVIFQQLLTGFCSFDSPEKMSLIKAILMDAPLPLPSYIPEVYRNFIAKCLQKEPNQRFQTIAEMRSALKNGQVEIDNEATILDSQTFSQPKNEAAFLKTPIQPTEDWREVEKRKQQADYAEVKRQPAEQERNQQALHQKLLIKSSSNYFIWGIGGIGILLILLLVGGIGLMLLFKNNTSVANKQDNTNVANKVNTPTTSDSSNTLKNSMK